MTDGSQVLVDTSTAVAYVVADHEHHAATVKSLSGRHLGLSGHAAYETFSVLTRLPPPLRRSARAVRRLLDHDFPGTCFLSAEAGAELFGALAGRGVSGGAVYDALVGACAVEHGMRLVTRDRRALDTYRALEVEVEYLS